ncbi:hypothetical protein BS78_03G218300 [Paspalum vaginatum]|nr:hypothetical protein BS78_03G218300 [Paspalum vaginatum]
MADPKPGHRGHPPKLEHKGYKDKLHLICGSAAAFKYHLRV